MIVALALSIMPLLTPINALSEFIPTPSHGYVYDQAHLLPEETAQGMDALLRRHDEESSQTVVVVTVPTVDSRVLKTSLNDLYKKIVVHDAGVLFLIVEHPLQSFIIPGPALRTRLPPETIQGIQDSLFDPLASTGRSVEAISRSAAGIVSKLTKAEHPRYVPPTPSRLERFMLEEGGPLLLLYVLLLIPVWLASVLARSRHWWPGGVLGFMGGAAVSWILVELSWVAIIGGVVMGTIGLMFDYIVSTHHEHILHYGGEHAWWAGGRWAKQFDRFHHRSVPLTS